MTAHPLAPLAWRPYLLALCATLAGCTVYQQPYPVDYGQPYPAYQEESVTRVYVDPPLMQPEPVLVDWAPPPMIVEVPPPEPFYGAIWIGGYWIWQDGWVWATGRWSAPPRPHYHWITPYYEHRGGQVVFIPGYWAAPGVSFAPPPPSAPIRRMRPSERGGGPRFRPNGPSGPFVPPPPGSRPGLIVPAPVGTSPRVTIGAPPVIQPGMRVHRPVRPREGADGPAELTITAPPGATRNGRPFERSMPWRPTAPGQPSGDHRDPSPGWRSPDRPNERPIERAPSAPAPGERMAPPVFGSPVPPRLNDAAPPSRPPSVPPRPWMQNRGPQGEVQAPPHPNDAAPPSRAPNYPTRPWMQNRGPQGDVQAPPPQQPQPWPGVRGERPMPAPPSGPGFQRQPMTPPPAVAPGNNAPRQWQRGPEERPQQPVPRSVGREDRAPRGDADAPPNRPRQERPDRMPRERMRD